VAYKGPKYQSRSAFVKLLNLKGMRCALHVGRTAYEGLRITGGTSVRISGMSQLGGNADTQRSTHLRETLVGMATIRRKEDRWTAALFRCEEDFCGSFDNSRPSGPYVLAWAGRHCYGTECSSSGIAFTYPQVGTSGGTNRVAKTRQSGAMTRYAYTDSVESLSISGGSTFCPISFHTRHPTFVPHPTCVICT
jgi:hypothetical protein